MLGNFMRELRKEKRLSQENIASILGVSQTIVSAWETDSKLPSRENLTRLAEILGVTIDELLKGKRMTQQKEIMYIPTDSSVRFIRIPVVGRIPAGIPIEAIEDIEDWEDYPLHKSIPGKQYFALKVKGDSMEPEYRDGDTIIIQQQERCESGDDCAVMIGTNDATFKRVRLHENGITIQPLNSKYDPVFYTKEEVINMPVKIIGVVVEVRRKVKKTKG